MGNQMLSQKKEEKQWLLGEMAVIGLATLALAQVMRSEYRPLTQIDQQYTPCVWPKTCASQIVAN